MKSRYRISPLVFAKKLNIPDEEALDLTLYCAKEKLLKIRYELTCPKCSADLLTVNNLGKLPKKRVRCDVCDEEFSPTSDDVWVTFYLTGQIKTILKKIIKEQKEKEKLIKLAKGEKNGTR